MKTDACIVPGTLAAALLVALAAPLSARIVGGELETRQAGDPAPEIARAGTDSAGSWVAWRVLTRSDQLVGCFSGWRSNEIRDCRCSLGDSQTNWSSSGDAGLSGGGGALEIYAEVAKGRVKQLVLASESCAMDAAGERVVALEGVRPAASVELLRDLALGRDPSSGGDELAEKALAALAHHAVPEAPAAILEVAREAQDEEQRAQALFWLSQTGSANAARWIREAIARDPAPEVREQGVFALSQLDDATDQLLLLIRESRDRAVQKQALFWLGQSDDPRALAEIERVLLR